MDNTENEHKWIVEQFESHRAHLRAVAFRMLGSMSEAEDAVQESWLRLSRSDTSDVENMGGWLTTVVGRVCLDMLRSRESRREEPLDLDVPEPVVSDEVGGNPEHEVIMADSVGLALLVVLDNLNPAERLAFVLHDIFAVSFEEIAPIVGRTPTAARQLASRARRRVRGTTTGTPADAVRQRQIVGAFLAASRAGNFEALLTMLDPNVLLRADRAAVTVGAIAEVRGSHAVAETFSGRAQTAQIALIDGMAGAVWAPGGPPRVVFSFTIEGGKIVEINMLADPERLSEMDLVVFND
jgi:RNA polymerase sigma factor (sigma-70 family)